MISFFKQFIIPCFILLHITATLYAQPAWQWGKRGGSGGTGSGALADEQVIDMATDKNGNVYVLAINNPGLANVDGHTGISVRDRLTLASWDCSGDFRWMKNVGGASSTIGRALAVDSLDGVYITGQTISNNSLGYTYFDIDSTLGNTSKRLFLVKYDTTGELKWLKMPQPDTANVAGAARPLDMSVAPNGDIFWMAFLTPGNYDGSAFTITSSKYYVVKYNTSGVYQSIVTLGMTTTDGGNSANLNGITNVENARFSRDHNSGRLYLAGQYDNTYGTLSMGSTAITSTGAIGALPMYVTAFDVNGANLWVKQSSSSLYASTRYSQAVVDPQGNIYIGGDIYTGNTFAGHTFTNSLSVHTFPFVMSLNSNGNLIWASSGLPKDGAVAGYSIAYTNNTIGLAGYYGGMLKWGTDTITAPLSMSGTAYILLARLNAATGAIIGMDSIASQNTLYNTATAIAADKNGNFFVGGKFDYRLFPAGNQISVAGGTYDWFVAKFGSAQCNCTLPVANFNAVNGSGTTVNFTYSGTTPVDSVSWSFGDGTTTATGTTTSHAYAAGGSYSVCATAYNACGSNTFCKAINAGSTGVNNIQGIDGISLYPNPATNILHIEHATAGTLLEIYNNLGQRVLQTKLHGGQDRVDVSGLSGGVYLLHFTGKDGLSGVSKLIKD